MKAIRHTIYLGGADAKMARVLRGHFAGNVKATGERIAAPLSHVVQQAIRITFQQQFPNVHKGCMEFAEEVAESAIPIGPELWGKREPTPEVLAAHEKEKAAAYWNVLDAELELLKRNFGLTDVADE